jgi:hypothetical protein
MIWDENSKGEASARFEPRPFIDEFLNLHAGLFAPSGALSAVLKDKERQMFPIENAVLGKEGVPALSRRIVWRGI